MLKIHLEKQDGVFYERRMKLSPRIMDKTFISQRIEAVFQESIEVKKQFVEQNKALLVEVVACVVNAFKNQKKLLVFGNGGSACDTQHFVGEFVNRYMHDRRPLPAIALTADMSILTSTGNDYGYDYVFERQIRALGTPGDIAIGISTSGKSKNVILALSAAKSLGLETMGLTGSDGGEVGKMVDYHINVSKGKTPRVQETHIVVLHLIAEMVDRLLFDLPC